MTNRLAYHNFRDAGRKHEILESETRVFTTHGATGSVSVLPPSPLGEQGGGPKWMLCVTAEISRELRKPPVFTVGCEQTCHLCPGRRHRLYHTGWQRNPPLALEEILALCSKAVHDTNLLEEMIWNESSPDRHKPGRTVCQQPPTVPSPTAPQLHCPLKILGHLPPQRLGGCSLRMEHVSCRHWLAPFLPQASTQMSPP